MESNLQNCEPKYALPFYKFIVSGICYCNGKLVPTPRVAKKLISPPNLVAQRLEAKIWLLILALVQNSQQVPKTKANIIFHVVSTQFMIKSKVKTQCTDGIENG